MTMPRNTDLGYPNSMFQCGSRFMKFYHFTDYRKSSVKISFCFDSIFILGTAINCTLFVQCDASYDIFFPIFFHMTSFFRDS